jgi:hypothetical protein
MLLRRLWTSILNRLNGDVQSKAVARPRRARPLLEGLEDRLVPTNWYVSTFGNDANPGTSPFAPLASIQAAVNLAGNGDRIHVAQGAYGYNAFADQLSGFLHINPAVVMVSDKSLEIYGGFNNNFTVLDPTLYHTVIEGGNTVRGVYVLSANQAINFLMSGFTIEQGLAQGERGLPAASAGNDRIFAFGGGMWINDAGHPNQGSFVLQDMVFYKNRSVGFNTNGLGPENSFQLAGVGGTGAGGGLAVRMANVTLHRVTFSENQAIGGNGDVRGGYGNGGAIQTDTSQVNGDNVIFVKNVAQAGSTGGSGVDSTGQHADGLAGAASFQFGGGAVLQQVAAFGNSALGGNAGGQAGSGQGGAFLVEGTSLSLTDASLRSNLAQGGNGTNGGLAGGGALDTSSGNVAFNRVQVIANSSVGGVGSNSAGSPTGGGIALVSVNPNLSQNQATITNSVFTDNSVSFAGGGSTTIGGGGGGIWFQGVTATLTHTTIAQNSLAPGLFYGEAMILLNDAAPTATTVTLAFSIVANHTANANADAVHVRGQGGRNSIVYNQVLDANNTLFDNSGGQPSDATGVGTITGAGSVIHAAAALFVSPGGPNYNYDLQPGSPAINQATGSSATIDIDQQPRVGVPDLGAYEAGQEPLARDTVATYDPGSGLWQIRNSNTSGFANLGMFTFGLGGNNSFPVVGHWTGRGPVTIGVVEVIDSSIPGQGKVLTWKLRNSLTPGAPDVAQFAYGAQGDIPVVGDWDGNGTTTVGIYQADAKFGEPPGTWKLRNSLSAGAPDFNTSGVDGFAFGGLPGDLPVTGDWDGNGTTTVGVAERVGTGGVLAWRLRNSNSAGGADAGNFAFGGVALGSLPIDGVGFVFGAGDFYPITGDWDSNGTTTVGVFTALGTWFLKNSNAPGAPDVGPFPFGEGQSRPLAGDFDGLP